MKALPLPLVGMSSPDEVWEGFLARRADLTSRMELAVCDGCDGCGVRCMAGFTVTRPEWEAVQSYLARLPVDEVERVRKQEKTVPWPGAAESGVPEVTVTYCRYRDQERNNCSVYPVRPTICRLFGQTRWLPCPIDAVSHYPEDAASVWNAYRNFDRRTWEEWEETEQGNAK